MSCNCGCHDDKAPATGWRRFVPLIVVAIIVSALIAGAVLKTDGKGKSAAGSAAKQADAAGKP